jgi:23S rRNA (pseudouridine1915-N3)-methyltransferase
MPLAIRVCAFGRKSKRPSGDIEHYVRLVQPYARLSVDIQKAASGGSPAQLRAREEKLLRSRWPKSCHAVALSQEGRRLDSEGFARWLDKRVEAGTDLVFNIGSAHGLSEGLKRECAEVLSLSKLTMSHGISLLVLVEQVYRACTILRGHPYHKQ